MILWISTHEESIQASQGFASLIHPQFPFEGCSFSLCKTSTTHADSSMPLLRPPASYHGLSSSPKLLIPASIALSAVLQSGAAFGHALLIQAASWAVICTYTFAKRRASTENQGHDARQDVEWRRRCWAAGGALVLASVCERAAGGGPGLWCLKVASPQGDDVLKSSH